MFSTPTQNVVKFGKFCSIFPLTLPVIVDPFVVESQFTKTTYSSGHQLDALFERPVSTNIDTHLMIVIDNGSFNNFIT